MNLERALFLLLGGLLSLVCFPPTLDAGPSKQLINKSAQILPANCPGLEEGIIDHCCDEFKGGKKGPKKGPSGRPQNEVRIRNITVNDCLGGHYKVKCVDQHGIGPTHLPPNKGGKKNFTKTKRKNPSDPTCLAYQNEFTKRDCLSEIPEVVCPAETTINSVTLTYLPTCQEVQNRARITCPKLPEINTEAIDTSLSLEPTASSATPFTTDATPENVYTGEIPSVFTNIPEEDRHQVLDVLRFELPANSLRYWVARSAFRTAIQQLPDAAVLGGALEGAVSCDTDQLSCEMKPLGLIDLDEALSDSLTELDSDTEYRDDLREFRISGLSYSEDWIDIEWTGWISIRSNGDWGFDLKNQARFNFLPMHEPENGYETSPELIPLATTQLINGLPSTLCTDTAAIEENGIYYGYKKPFLTTCNSATEQYKNYDILDEYPRPIDPLPVAEHMDNSEGIGGNPFLADIRCFDIPWASAIAPGPRATVPLSGTNMVLTYPITILTGSLTEPQFTSLRNSTARFGCAGQEFRFRTDLPGLAALSIETDMVELSIDLEYVAVSAAGTDFATTLKLGGFEANIHPGLLNVEFHVLVEISEWIEENVWGGWLIGWALRWVERIFSGIVTIIANGLNVTVIWSLPSTYEIAANDITANVYGVIRQIPYLEVDTSDEAEQEGVAVGTRRLVTSTPSVTRPSISYNWYFDECSESYTALGEGRFIDALRSLLGGCLFEQAANVIRYVTSPIVTIFIDFADWLFNFTDAIQDAINETLITNVGRIQEQNDFAGLIHKSVEQSYYKSNYLTSEVISPDPDTIVNRLPYPYSQVCTIAGTESGACEIMELLMGGPRMVRHSHLDINRLGAKTHYRSYRDFTGYLVDGGEFDFNFPPVRFCTGGDNPPADDPVYPFTKSEIDSFSTFHEIKVDAPGDWENQCALFIDIKPQFCISVENQPGGLPPPDEYYGSFFAPTHQTVLLVNEIFFCPENSWCDITQPNLKRRAEAAVCSILADTWYHVATSLSELTATPTRNLLDSLSDLTDTTTIEEFLERVGYSGEEVSRMTTFVTTCRASFDAAGGTIPTAPQRNPCQTPTEEGGSS